LHVGWGQFSDVAIQKSKSLFDIRKKSHKPNKRDTIYRVLVYKIFAGLGGGNSGSTQTVLKRDGMAKEGGGGWGLLFAAPSLLALSALNPQIRACPSLYLASMS